MSPALLHALIDRHRIATGAADQDNEPDDDPGMFASREGLIALSQMPIGG
ncbi:hypothetical protein [Kitasatospora aureofaciens]|nr:hypothetical protein SPMV1_gp44 [Streptomyces phage mu1/6]ABD94209.1 unknown [Streptomyces phage mu1/6]